MNCDEQKKEIELCPTFTINNISRLHLGHANVPEEVFSNLHHPSSPAKWSFFFSKSKTFPRNVVKAPCESIYMTRTGSRSSQPNKCVAVTFIADGLQSINQQSHRYGYTALNTDQYQQDYPVDIIGPKSFEKLLLYPLLQDLKQLLDVFREKMGDPMDSNGNRRAVTVMVANEGVMDLLLNFLCSAEAAKIDLKSIVVFVGTEDCVELVESMGVNGIYSPALGSMPANAAGGYLDDTFARMMWFKTTSVYLALVAGFEVLFQDVDLVWLKDPFPYFKYLAEDILFMDDGARTPRYTPFFVNSGFYFVKYNARTLHMFETMMKCGSSEIGQTHSHQSVLIKHISEVHHLFGLQVFVLDMDLFPSGQAYHENKKFVKKIQDRTYRPFVFHMCWTSNRVDKVVYFKDIGLWYLPEVNEVCNNGKSMIRYASEQSKRKGSQDLMRNKCCAREKYWPKE
eukprot:gene9477-12768_t